jgi:hypothetical protein
MNLQQDSCAREARAIERNAPRCGAKNMATLQDHAFCMTGETASSIGEQRRGRTPPGQAGLTAVSTP